MNSGTRISTPVSSVAGLVALVAVSPLMPGSLWDTRSVGDNLDHVALFHVLAAYYKVVGDGYLFEGLLVHEYAAGGILVEILVGAALYAHVLKLEAYLEGAVEHTAVGDVLQLGAHHGVAFAGLYVLEVDAYPHLVVQAYAGAFLNFL